jgi:hypothetical protein
MGLGDTDLRKSNILFFKAFNSSSHEVLRSAYKQGRREGWRQERTTKLTSEEEYSTTVGWAL